MANIELNNLEYLNIQILKSEITNLSQKPLQRGDLFELDYKVKASHYYNLEKKLVRVIIYLEIIVMQKGEKLSAGAKFEIDNYFGYDELEKFARKENERVLIESEFAEVVKGLAYSSARGIIHSKLSGTFLEGTILPVKMSTDI